MKSPPIESAPRAPNFHLGGDGARPGLEMLGTLWDTLPIGVVVLAPGDTTTPVVIADCNPAACAMHGYQREELIGQSIDLLQAVPWTHNLGPTWFEFQRVRLHQAGESLHRRKDGTTFCIDFSTSYVCVGGRDYVVGFDRDVTAERRIETSVREKHERWSAAVAGSDDGVWDWNLATGDVWVSPRWEELLGSFAKERIHRFDEMMDHVHPEQRASIKAALQAHLAHRTPSFQADFQMQRIDGSWLWVSSRGRAVCGADGQPVRVIGTTTDITQRKSAEAELKRLHEQLLEASRAAGMAEVATGVLHNVGNVLNSVNVSATLVADHVRSSKVASVAKLAALFDEHKTDLADFLGRDTRGRLIPSYLTSLAESLKQEQEIITAELDGLRKNIEHIKEIVAMQQSYARISGVTESISIVEVIEDALRIDATSLVRHEIETLRDYQARPVIATDKHKVVQILVNLVTNAKHACGDSDRPDKRIIVRITGDELHVRIAIEDNGVGIPTENLTRIFNHGFTTRKTGHGYGLHSAALAAKELGGSLTVNSGGPGRGATFILELPCNKPAAATVG
jgi:PAS domain S-box-containing protein